MKRIFLPLVILLLYSPIELDSKEKNYLEDKSFQISEDLIPLLDLLREKGFNLKFEIPPRKDVYGLFDSKTKTLWISPMSFFQGIGRQTLIHEATHAVQSCPNGLLTPINLELPISPFLNNEIQRILLTNYDSKQYLIEKEAFSLQSQKNSIDILLKALKERCN